MAGFIGPSIVIVTKDLWPSYLFAATFVGQSVMAALAGAVLIRLKFPPPISREQRDRGRPLGAIARNRRHDPGDTVPPPRGA